MLRGINAYYLYQKEGYIRKYYPLIRKKPNTENPRETMVNGKECGWREDSPINGHETPLSKDIGNSFNRNLRSPHPDSGYFNVMIDNIVESLSIKNIEISNSP